MKFKIGLLGQSKKKTKKFLTIVLASIFFLVGFDCVSSGANSTNSTNSARVVIKTKPLKGRVNKLTALLKNMENSFASKVKVKFYYIPVGIGAPEYSYKYIDSKTINLKKGSEAKATVNWDMRNIHFDNGGLWPQKIKDYDLFLIKVILESAGNSSNLGDNLICKDYYEFPVAISKSPKVKLSCITFLFFNPFTYDVNAGLNICPALPPGWKMEFNEDIYNLNNFKLEGNEIKTIRLGFVPPADCYQIPVEKNFSSDMPINVIGYIDGRVVGDMKYDLALPVPIITYPRWSFSFQGGASFAIMDLGERYKSSYTFAVGVDYYLNPRVSVLGSAGFNQFRPKYAFSHLGHTYWWNLSANIKWEFTTKPTRPYVNGGIGLYIPEAGSMKPGFNVGAGLDRTIITPNLVLEFGVNYHHILIKGEDQEFYTVHAGLIYRL